MPDDWITMAVIVEKQPPKTSQKVTAVHFSFLWILSCIYVFRTIFVAVYCVSRELNILYGELPIFMTVVQTLSCLYSAKLLNNFGNCKLALLLLCWMQLWWKTKKMWGYAEAKKMAFTGESSFVWKPYIFRLIFALNLV